MKPRNPHPGMPPKPVEKLVIVKSHTRKQRPVRRHVRRLPGTMKAPIDPTQDQAGSPPVAW
jgi:hypothetical protein